LKKATGPRLRNSGDFSILTRRVVAKPGIRLAL
jgi:hypothetical protein